MTSKQNLSHIENEKASLQVRVQQLTSEKKVMRREYEHHLEEKRRTGETIANLSKTLGTLKEAQERKLKKRDEKIKAMEQRVREAEGKLAGVGLLEEKLARRKKRMAEIAHEMEVVGDTILNMMAKVGNMASKLYMDHPGKWREAMDAITYTQTGKRVKSKLGRGLATGATTGNGAAESTAACQRKKRLVEKGKEMAEKPGEKIDLLKQASLGKYSKLLSRDWYLSSIMFQNITAMSLSINIYIYIRERERER